MEILSQLLPFIFLIAIMYFVIIRPQQKEAKNRLEMIQALKKGDRVVTTGGIIATVYKVEEQFLSVKINEETTVKITKEAVARKYEDEA
ncbi:preprotein translocase subunit YajC [Sulfurimonas sp.]|uniref:preprotein translocase subunit YajC n=1 Tax=Sulfurimonas sp. TaxID=2022749 RepID=UPI0025FC2DC3|nr:preprotein translocase subunit YajC [Sulfurimonas sp.]MBW6488077.1 preprotein translocase subunit YajC [Sulfurimonas sp.]